MPGTKRRKFSAPVSSQAVLNVPVSTTLCHCLPKLCKCLVKSKSDYREARLEALKKGKLALDADAAILKEEIELMAFWDEDIKKRQEEERREEEEETME